MEYGGGGRGNQMNTVIKASVISALGRHSTSPTKTLHWIPRTQQPKDSNTQMVFSFLLTSVNKCCEDPSVFDNGLMFTWFRHRWELVLLSEQNHYTISPIKHPKRKLPTLSHRKRATNQSNKVSRFVCVTKSRHSILQQLGLQFQRAWQVFSHPTWGREAGQR